MDGAIVFVMPGGSVGYMDLVRADCVIGVHLDGSGRVLKNRDGHEGVLTRECVSWLRANPTNRPEDWED